MQGGWECGTQGPLFPLSVPSGHYVVMGSSLSSWCLQGGVGGRVRGVCLICLWVGLIKDAGYTVSLLITFSSASSEQNPSAIKKEIGEPGEGVVVEGPTVGPGR